MKYILSILILALVFTGCSRRPAPHSKYKHHSKPITHVSKKSSTLTSSQKNNSTLNKIYAQYRQWKGTPYKYGGLTKGGVDCSGFVLQSYKKLFNIRLPRSTKDQVKKGKRVYINQLHAGDLVFFKTGWNVRHVGIYLEKGKFAHASSSKGVIISNMHTGYWKKNYWQARRLF
ncbi:MAG: hypothetical protein COA44_08525 [Arcobacter sp.]|nr:MAG: hypothetical protein COA44_08525 [Arcobacter sp.]